MIRSKYSSLIGMVIALILFIGIDKWLYWQGRTSRQNSHFELYYLWVIVSGLAICALLCAMSRLTMLKSQRSYPIN